MSNKLELTKSDIHTIYWKSGNLHVVTKQGGLVFGCPSEQQQMVTALKHLGFKIAPKPLTKEQQWMKAAHHVINTLYFAGKLQTPQFTFELLALGRDGQYNVKTRTISLCSGVFRNGLTKSPRYAFDMLIHESMHQYLHQRGWRPVKGLNPHTELNWIALCHVLLDPLGLPAKTDFTQDELETFPYGITHDAYYKQGLKHRLPLYDWR